jgi:hypothetical protein
MDPRAPRRTIPTPSPQEPVQAELQWTLTKDGRRFRCQLQSRGKYGWECQFLEGEELIAGRGFPMRVQALEWAAFERDEHEREGWTLLS